jgi:hypothetical protein
MYAYTTLEELRRRNASLLAETRAAKMARASTRSPSDATFLSHSTTDVEFLPAVITLLEDHGGQVYIDKKDETLPPYTNRETATALRTRIVQSRRFVLFATSRSKDSRWMPWELGIADGVKDSRRVAVLPGVDTAADVTWTEREYLGIYNRVVHGDLQGHSQKVWMVLDQVKNTATELSRWLTGA